MHELLATNAEHQRAPYSPPYVSFDSTFTRSDLWRAIPTDKQTLLARRGGLSEVKPVATDGTHFLSFDPITGEQHIGHVTNLIKPDPQIFFNRKPSAPKEKKPKVEKPLPVVHVDLSFLSE